MDEELKSTAVLTVDTCPDGLVARDAESDRRRCMTTGVMARVVVPFLGLILATLIFPAPVLAGAYWAYGYIEEEFYPAGPTSISSESSTGATVTQQFVAGDVRLESNAAASGGNLSLFALASINNMGNWASGHVWSRAAAQISEPVAPNWSLSPIQTLIFNYQISVSGALFATISGYGAAGSGAGLDYSYRVGNSSGSGSWFEDTAGHSSKSGTWNGVISSAFTAQKGSTFDLTLWAHADTGGGKNYDPLSNATVVAMADFGHTLTWLGITGVQAFDSQGNEVQLPSDFYLPLIGGDSGFDYWYSAAAPPPPPPPGSVPEPATVLLLGFGLVVAGLMRKSGVPHRNKRITAMLLTVGAVATLGLSAPSPAHAIPIPGDYAFTSGLTGTFHVEGFGLAGHLTAWEIDDPTNVSLHWSNTQLPPAGLQFEVANNSFTFQTSNFGHYFLTLDWSTGQWTNSVSPGGITHSGDFTYAGRTDVPEPSTLLLLAFGLLVLSGYGRTTFLKRSMKRV